MKEIVFSSLSYIKSNIKLDISKIKNNDQVEKVIIKYYSILLRMIYTVII